MTFKIYQLNENSHEFAFRAWNAIQDKFNINNYDCKYNGNYAIDVSDDNVDDVLETIYINFNVHRPDDFNGWSLSVSDVVCINDVDYYYVDRFGYKKISL